MEVTKIKLVLALSSLLRSGDFFIKKEVYMKVYTINGKVVEGATLDGSAIVIGGKKIGEAGVLPVSGAEEEIFFAEVEETSAGKKLVACAQVTTKDEIIVVFRTDIGVCGGNAHVGKGTNDFFPGKIICTGYLSQSASGGTGKGRQIVAVIPKNKVFGVKVFGSTSNTKYYKWDGERLLTVL